ncbi:MAG TPA: hypothetical protein VNQ79_04970, partial [Blastocatellia bacterium]|nr:hypothetical protein [Blastocatellia bacterium]
MKKTLITLLICFVMALPALVWRTSVSAALTPAPPPADACLTFSAPLVTHGFTRTNALPNGDQFLLSSPLSFTVTTPPDAGATTFTLPSGVIGFPGAQVAGIALETPGATMTAVSCLESFWDLNFYLASRGNSLGDTVRLLLIRDLNDQNPIELARFQFVGSMGAMLTSLNSAAGSLHLNDRFASGANAVLPGTLIPFNNPPLPPNATGGRSGLLTFAFKADFMNGCFHLVTEIKRGTRTGVSAIAFNDIVVNRDETAGDRARPQTGLLGGLTGGYPTGLRCQVICPPCPPVSGGGGGPCPTNSFGAPEVVHGFATGPGLPNGDQFLLNTSLGFVIGQGTAATFDVNNSNFGAFPGFPGTQLQGVAVSAPSGTVRILSCLESMWDINFIVASNGTTVGDKLRLFLATSPTDNSPIELATFTAEAGGLRLTSVNESAGTVHLNDRFATGSNRVAAGGFIPFGTPAGSSGQRTGLITIALNATTMGCFHLGVDIMRGAGAGTLSLVFTDIVVNRDEVAGDRTRTGTGLLGGLTGGFPTGKPCADVCPPCPAVSGGGGGPCPPNSFEAPEVVHGFTKTSALPNGDQFLLNTSLGFVIGQGTATAFKVNNANFGATVGFPGTQLEGVAVSTPNGTVRILSCLESMWDINFIVASNGTTVGDKLRLFLATGPTD